MSNKAKPISELRSEFIASLLDTRENAKKNFENAWQRVADFSREMLEDWIRKTKGTYEIEIEFDRSAAPAFVGVSLTKNLPLGAVGSIECQTSWRIAPNEGISAILVYTMIDSRPGPVEEYSSRATRELIERSFRSWAEKCAADLHRLDQ